MDARLDSLIARLRDGVAWLPDKPEETPEGSARALWLAAAGQPCSVVAAQWVAVLPALDAAGLARLDALLERRLAGEPLAHLTGRQHFCGLEMLAGRQALVPRVETVLLAQAAIAALQRRPADAGEAAIVLDACTGSGNVALAIAQHCPAARVAGADLSAEAVDLARANARWLGLDDRVRLLVGDLLAPFAALDVAGRVDLLTCNPPYISSAKVPLMAAEIAGHEPALAFDGGPLGVSVLSRLLEEAPAWLRPGGVLLVEVGLGQGPALLRRLARDPAWSKAGGHADASGAIRVLELERSDANPATG